MIRIRVSACATLMLFLVFPVAGQGESPSATVHLKFCHSLNGDDLGMGEVVLFKSEETGRDFAALFHNNTASNIPYGTYVLRAHQQGFWSHDRRVLVYQPQVWVVLGLHIGMDHMLKNQISGRIRNLPATQEAVWVRIASVRSNTLRDARVDESGAFSIAMVPDDLYILAVWSGRNILDTRSVSLPTPTSLEIDLRK